MTNRNALFANYLSKHYAHLGGPTKFRHQKKAGLEHNYARFMPVCRDAHILEIGPGYGELLDVLVNSRGYKNVQAVDLSQEVAEFCNTVAPGTTVHVADTNEFLLRNRNKFDCVFMLHVLEHVPKSEVITLLSSIRGSLAPLGRLVVEVPNMANPLLGLDVRYADFTHEVGFTETSLRYVLEQAGFSEVSTFAPSLAWNHPAHPNPAPIYFWAAVYYRLQKLRAPQTEGRHAGAVRSCQEVMLAPRSRLAHLIGGRRSLSTGRRLAPGRTEPRVGWPQRLRHDVRLMAVSLTPPGAAYYGAPRR